MTQEEWENSDLNIIEGENKWAGCNCNRVPLEGFHPEKNKMFGLVPSGTCSIHEDKRWEQ